MVRKCLFWAHLAIGVVAGSVALLLCVTGALLSFQRQIVDLAERDGRALPPSVSAQRVSPAVLIASAASVNSSRVSNIEWLPNARLPARIYFADRSMALLNSWTGEVLGRGAERWRRFFRLVLNLHLNLALPGPGKLMVDFANAAFVFLVLSGLWLWWPRQWRWRALRGSIALRFDLRGKARDWNWHNALGFWFMVPLLVMGASGVILSFKPADSWWRDLGRRHLRPAVIAANVRPGEGGALPGWEGTMEAVIRQCPGWHSIMFTNSPSNGQGIVTLMVSMGEFGQRTQIRNVSVDQVTHSVVKISTWGNEEAGTRARAIARFGHTGEILGPWGQALALAGCLAGTVVVYTGFALSWRRFFRSPGRATLMRGVSRMG